MEQADELEHFYEDEFTGLPLYGRFASNRQRLHRQAYGSAYALARLAEQ